MVIAPVNVAGSMESGGGAVNQKTRHVVDNCLDWLRRTIYPPACVLCNLPTRYYDLCTGCAGDMARNRHACSSCALPLQNAFDRVCARCLKQPPHFDQCHAPLLYEYPLDRLIQRFKFQGDLCCGRVLAELVLESLQQANEPLRAHALVPVPLFRKRLVERGFNQSLELARDLGKGLGLPVLNKQLLRIRNTRAQSELGADKRTSNVRGAFKAINTTNLPVSIALVDDVLTTGSTVNECALTLKKAGVQQVDVWLIARAP